MIWCVEDDTSIRDIEIYALVSMGLEARGFDNGTTFWEALRESQPELVILDVMLPGVDGVELLRRMKASEEFAHIPVIMATAKGTEYDKIQSLDLGADDYLVKPFSMMEMVSRVKAVLRRCQPKPKQTRLCLDGLELNMESHAVTVAGNKIMLTYKEFELLHLLLAHPNKVFTRDQLYAEVWGMDLVGETRTVDMHIRTLRQKLGDWAQRIQTVRNVGYLLEEKYDK